MRNLTGILSVALAASLVAACGGGGGGSGGSTVAAPTGDTRAITARFEAVHGRSDALLATDFHWVGPGPQTYPRRFRGIYGSCRGPVCTGVMPSQVQDIPLSLSDLEADDRYEIFATRNGVPLTRGTSEATDATGSVSSRDFGGWVDHNAFGLAHGYFYGPAGDYIGGLVGAYSFGDASSSAPAQGSAVWWGAMIGAEARQLDTVQGDASVTVDFATVEASVAFTNILNLARGTAIPSMRWSRLAIDSGGRFSSAASPPNSRAASLVGTFYGPNHEEVGGVFERNDIAGAFGARRQ